MKKITPLLVVALSPASLLAHPGNHTGTPTEIGWHWLTQPDHLILGAVSTGLAVALGVYLYKRRRRDA
ncbi:hypothetical protein [Mucisphaera sp.]|uniref:hypothetical protein n=1 Tax=Mucisphaera sp. TaxID=2913024 RepID=UPI003D115EE1